MKKSGFNFALLPLLSLLIVCQTQAAIVGAIDGIDSKGMVSGWLIDPKNQKAALKLEFFVNSFEAQAKIGEVEANLIRQDLLQAGYLTANHGFHFDLPVQFQDGQTHTLLILAQDALQIRYPMTGSPIRYNSKKSP